MLLMAFCLLELVIASGARAAIGIAGFDGSVNQRGGATATQAASHPYQASTTIEFTRTTNGDGQPIPQGSLKDAEVRLPPGLIGNPNAAAQCTHKQLGELEQVHLSPPSFRSGCPAASQVGIVKLNLGPNNPLLANTHVGLFNMVPPFGVPAQFAFNFAGTEIFLNAGIRTGADYGVTVSVTNASQGLLLFASTVTFWGVPADPSHDPLRGSCLNQDGTSNGSCPSGAPLKPLLRLPTSCAGPQLTTLSADSWQEPGLFATAGFLSHDNQGNLVGADGCQALRFGPTLTAQPTTTVADSPSGLSVDIRLPQDEAPEGLGTPDLKQAVVTLPQGLTVNPSSANGLAGCSPAQVDLHGPAPAACPDASKIGRVEIDTPLVDHPLVGGVYLATPHDNPFGSLLALYIAVDDPETGVVVKLAGHVEADPRTGQLTTTFAENPQLPFSDLKLDFFSGALAPLRTPATCGSFTTNSVLTPWSAPATPSATSSESFPISSAPSGAACPHSEAEEPNQPGFEAGTTTPLAGLYSPFTLNLRREDGSQQIGRLDVTLPPGLTGRLAGVPYCLDADIAAAQVKTGVAEKQSPSCPAASQVGTVDVAAGAGPTPVHVQGKAYLAGPYRGAPLSMVIVTPAVAGPFDLGVVTVRTALYVNERTARISAKSDPLPTILEGIPLDVRSIAVQLDRPGGFTLNPSSCEAMSITGQAISTTGNVAPLRNRFQVGGCRGLRFKPQLKLRLKGATKRAGHPALKAVVTYPTGGGYANIARAQVGLPHSEFLDQGNLDKVCRQAQLQSGTCPKRSIYGRAKAWTPLLDKPLEGPVYIGVGYGYKLPALVADLNGQVRILLVGRVDTTKHEGIRNTFEVVPDAPVSRFVLTMKGGKRYGLLENSENICRKTQRASALFNAQNGLRLHMRPKIHNDCGKKKKGKKNRAHGKGKGGAKRATVAHRRSGGRR